VSTVSYLHNIATTKRGCPYKMFIGKEPNLNNLRVIGCTVYYNVAHKGDAGKLDPRAKKGILIGYDNMSNYYRIYNFLEKKVIRSCDVRFNEEVFPLRKKEILVDFYENPIEPSIEKADEMNGTTVEQGEIESVENVVIPPRRSERILAREQIEEQPLIVLPHRSERIADK